MVMHCGSSKRPEVYSEEQLNRKIRLEQRRMPVVSEDTPPDNFCHYVGARHVSLLMRNAKLSPLERKVFMLSLYGASLSQMANAAGVSRASISRTTAVIKRKLRSAVNDKYHGLHEVYWSEVRRHIYRKPAHKPVVNRVCDDD